MGHYLNLYYRSNDTARSYTRNDFKMHSSKGIKMFMSSQSWSCDAEPNLNRQKFKKILSFTLIELLVVIAVLSILLSLLSGHLKKAIETARAIKCLNNQGQNAALVIMYDGDFGMVPFFADETDLKRPWFSSVNSKGIAPQSMHCPLRSWAPTQGGADPQIGNFYADSDRNAQGFGNSDYSVNTRLNLGLQPISGPIAQTKPLIGVDRKDTPFFPIKGIVNDASGKLITNSGKIVAVPLPSGTVMIGESWTVTNNELSGSQNDSSKSFGFTTSGSWDSRHRLMGEHFGPAVIGLWEFNLLAIGTFAFFDGHAEMISYYDQTWKRGENGTNWYRPSGSEGCPPGRGLLMWEGRTAKP